MLSTKVQIPQEFYLLHTWCNDQKHLAKTKICVPANQDQNDRLLKDE